MRVGIGRLSQDVVDSIIREERCGMGLNVFTRGVDQVEIRLQTRAQEVTIRSQLCKKIFTSPGTALWCILGRRRGV